MTVNSCICTKEFEKGVKRVSKRDYSVIGDKLQQETKRSLEGLRSVVKSKKGTVTIK
jgi:hypothetical protein